MTASDISGMLLDKSYFNDVIGTYMRYDVKVAVPFGMESEWNSMYETITQPIDGHQFVLPYANGVVTVTGRVQDIKDVYVRLQDNKLHWRGISFSIIANHPTKQYTLSEILTIGAAPLPDASDVNVGDVYEYTANGWETIADGADTFY